MKRKVTDEITVLPNVTKLPNVSKSDFRCPMEPVKGFRIQKNVGCEYGEKKTLGQVSQSREGYTEISRYCYV